MLPPKIMPPKIMPQTGCAGVMTAGPNHYGVSARCRRKAELNLNRAT